MNKLILIGVFCAMGASISAFADDGKSYIQTSAGLSAYDFDVGGSFGSIETKDRDTAFRFALGGGSKNLRYALDYTDFGTVDYVEQRTRKDNVVGLVNVQETFADTFNAKSVGLSLIVAMDDGETKWVPYVGVRASANKLEYEMLGIETSSLHQVAGYTKLKGTTFGLGGFIGSEYKITPSVSFDLYSEYNHLGEAETENKSLKIKGNQLGVNAGVRMNF